MADAWGTAQDETSPQVNSLESNDNSHTGDQPGPTDDAGGTEEIREVIDPKAGNEEFQKAVEDRGWTAPVPFDYEAYNAQGGDDADWQGLSLRYEWKDEYGDVAPRVPQLEAILFEGDYRMRRGNNFEALEDFKADVDGPNQLYPIREFAGAALHPVLLENLKLCGYAQPTPIQSYCIPYGLKGHDMVAIAQTGSGKTAAYMIPVISKLMGKAPRLCGPKPNTTSADYNERINKVVAEPLVLIVVPTRELAIQIFDEARRLCYRSMLRPCVTYGGLPYAATCLDLGKGCDILIATPGRLVDLMDKPSVLRMRRVKHTIIDEADELLENDWEEQLAKIMSGGDMNVDANHNFMLFSATFPKRAIDLAHEYLAEDFYKISIGRAGSTHRNIKQDVIWVEGDQKQTALWDLLMSLQPSRTLIFTNSRRTVDILDDFLYNRGMPTTSIHSQRNQREREDALRAFRTGKCPILIATGVSARGWDVKDITHVINFDLPSPTYGGIAEYVHRIGRTARIGNTGTASSFYNDRNEDIGKALTNVLLESGSAIPEFLQQYVHEDGKAHFEEEDEDNAGASSPPDHDGGDAAAGWGGEGSSTEAEQPAAWGAPKDEAEGEHDGGASLAEGMNKITF